MSGRRLDCAPCRWPLRWAPIELVGRTDELGSPPAQRPRLRFSSMHPMVPARRRCSRPSPVSRPPRPRASPSAPTGAARSTRFRRRSSPPSGKPISRSCRLLPRSASTSLSARRCCSSMTASSSATTLPRCSTALRAAPSCSPRPSARSGIGGRRTPSAVSIPRPPRASSSVSSARPIEAEERPAAEAWSKGSTVARSPWSKWPRCLQMVGSLSELAAEPTALAESRDLEALERFPTTDPRAAGHPGGCAIGSRARRGARRRTRGRARARRARPPRFGQELSPRYRLLRQLARGFTAQPTEDLRARLPPPSDPLERSREAGLRWPRRRRASRPYSAWPPTKAGVDGALALALAAEGKLAMSGSWSSWERVLERGLRLARRLDRREVEAYIPAPARQPLALPRGVE